MSVHQAALDEVGHAERCWQLAETFGGAKPAAAAFPFAEETRVRVSLAELAAATVREGCLAETLGAHVLGVAAEHAPEPEVRERPRRSKACRSCSRRRPRSSSPPSP